MKSWVPALGLVGVGFFIAGCVIAGVLGGAWLDDRLKSQPAFLIAGILLGILLACFGVYSMIKPFLDSARKGGKYK